MIPGRYSRNLLILVMLLAIASLGLGWLVFKVHAWITLFNLFLVWLILVGLILYQVRRINREVSRFFQAIRNQDYTRGYNLHKSDPLFRDMHVQMNTILEDLGRVRNEKEQDYQFFRTVFDHADVGLVVYDEEGIISLINRSACTLLGTPKPGNIRAINLPGKEGQPFPGDIRPGERTMIKLTRDKEIVQLSLRSRHIKVSGKNLTLLSVQNIRQELEQHEVESWQRLIRVFIHEIMNSVSPITLTASGIIGLLETGESNAGPPDEQQQGEILSGLKAIRNRSKGISTFMNSYRQLTRIPTPDFAWADVKQLSETLGRLMKDDFQRMGIAFTIMLSPRETKLWCDEKLVEQVLINLLRNASEALVNTFSPAIVFSCVSLQERVEITVKDNGPGIDPGIQENIFVPFFSTKAEGTGIGLSLSRQIMALHGGRIAVHSVPGETSFVLIFPSIPTR